MVYIGKEAKISIDGKELSFTRTFEFEVAPLIEFEYERGFAAKTVKCIGYWDTPAGRVAYFHKMSINRRRLRMKWVRRQRRKGTNRRK